MNQIEKLNLEPRVAALKAEEKSEREIANILTREMNQEISRSAVHRYFTSHAKVCQDAIATSGKLQVKKAELELDTISSRHEIIAEIRNLAEAAKQSGDYKTAVAALDKCIDALDSLDTRLGRLSSPALNALNVNIRPPSRPVFVTHEEGDQRTFDRIQAEEKQPKKPGEVDNRPDWLKAIDAEQRANYLEFKRLAALGKEYEKQKERQQ